MRNYKIPNKFRGLLVAAESSRRGPSRLLIALFITLLVLILIRLVWMQLRTFQVFPEPGMTAAAKLMSDMRDDRCAQLILKSARTGEGLQSYLEMYAGSFGREPLADWIGNRVILKTFCTGGLFNSSAMIRLNEWLFCILCMMAGFLCRLITGQWFVGMIAVVSIMSRGRVVGELGSIGVTYLQMLLFTLWSLGLVWYRMTLSRWPLLLAAAAVCSATLADVRFIILMPVFPAVVGFMALVGVKALSPEQYHAPKPFSPIGPQRFDPTAPSFPWPRVRRDLLIYLATLAGGVGLLQLAWHRACYRIEECSLAQVLSRPPFGFASQLGILDGKVKLLFQDWDTHFLVSLFGIVLMVVPGVRQRGSRYVEGATTILVGCALIGLVRWWFLAGELNLIRSSDWGRLQHALIWAEPVILAFAMVALYRLWEIVVVVMGRRKAA